MACHASGGLLATAGADRKVLVWDVDGGFCTHYFKGHKDVVTNIMFHPDTNKTLVTSMQCMQHFLPSQNYAYCCCCFLILLYPLCGLRSI